MRSGKLGIVFFNSSALTVFKLSFLAVVEAVETPGVPIAAIVGATSAPALERAVVAAAAGCDVVVLESLPPQAARNRAAGAMSATRAAKRVLCTCHLNDDECVCLSSWTNRPASGRRKMPKDLKRVCNRH